MLSALIMSSALLAQDSAASTATPPAAVTVDQYHRNYEPPKDDSELRYDSHLEQAMSAKESQMEGSWLVATPDGNQLISLELRGNPGQLQGAWRAAQAGYGLNSSGFVSNVSQTGREMEIDYFVGTAHSPTVLQLRRDNDGQWRGVEMNVAGQRTPVVLTRSGT